MTILHYASKAGAVEVVQVLLEKEAAVDAAAPVACALIAIGKHPPFPFPVQSNSCGWNVQSHVHAIWSPKPVHNSNVASIGSVPPCHGSVISNTWYDVPAIPKYMTCSSAIRLPSPSLMTHPG